MPLAMESFPSVGSPPSLFVDDMKGSLEWILQDVDQGFGFFIRVITLNNSAAAQGGLDYGSGLQFPVQNDCQLAANVGFRDRGEFVTMVRVEPEFDVGTAEIITRWPRAADAADHFRLFLDQIALHGRGSIGQGPFLRQNLIPRQGDSVLYQVVAVFVYEIKTPEIRHF